jgi:hypothetical protein
MPMGSQGGAYLGPHVGEPQLEPTTFLSASQTLNPIGTQTYILTGASAITITLLSPLPPTGTVLTFICGTAAAHVVTTGASQILADGVSGSPHTKWTGAAYYGSSCTLQMANPPGYYMLIGNIGGTVS